MLKKILILGGTGFIGNHLSKKALERIFNRGFFIDPRIITDESVRIFWFAMGRYYPDGTSPY